MKRAIVVSGGGSKGAYAVGVLDQFRQSIPALQFDVFVGTSTGALMAPFLALGKLDTLIDIYQNTTTSQVIKEKSSQSILNQSSLYSTTPLKKLINRHLSDAECDQLIRSRSKSIYILTACLQTKKLTIFTNRNMPASKSKAYDFIKFKDPVHFKRALLASANQPIFMPPIRVNKDLPDNTIKDRQYVDGGILEYAGIEAAIDAKSDEIFTIYLSAEKDQTTTERYSKLFDILGPSVGILTGNVGFHDLRVPQIHNTSLLYIEKVKSNLLANGVSQVDIDDAFDTKVPGQEFEFTDPHIIHLIRPSRILNAGTNGLEFNPSEMRNMFAIGQMDARDFIQDLADEEITWQLPPIVT